MKNFDKLISYARRCVDEILTYTNSYQFKLTNLFISSEKFKPCLKLCCRVACHNNEEQSYRKGLGNWDIGSY